MPRMLTIKVSYREEPHTPTSPHHETEQYCMNDFEAATQALYDIMERLDLAPQSPEH